MKRLRRIISRTFRRAERPWRSLWNFAKRGGSRAARLRRWRALRSWARDHQIASQKDGRKRRAHKFWQARRIYGKKVRRLKRKRHHGEPQGGPLETIDGRLVPGWMAPHIRQIRARGRWKGVVISGYRSPEYSEQLCRNMCGAPRCPGRCAGRASNHACPPSGKGVPYEGAIDVTDYWTFASEARAIGAPFKNALPSDPVHFSRSGV